MPLFFIGYSLAESYALRLWRSVRKVLLVKPPERRTARAVFNTPRRAWFTASSLGNTFAISGSSKTTLLDSRRRFTYLPRLPPFIEAKSYSARMPFFEFRLAFFIKLSFAMCCQSGTDDTNRITLLGMRHNQKSTAHGFTDGQVSLFKIGVVFIGKSPRQRIAERRGRFAKFNAMLFAIGRSFPAVPGEDHMSSIARQSNGFG